MPTTTKARRTAAPAKRRAISETDAAGRARETASEKDAEPRVALTGAPNPYALADLVSGRRIDWGAVPDRRAVIEDVFDMPYSQIIGSASSPLFYGTSFRSDGTPVRKRPAAPPPSAANDAEASDADSTDVASAKTLADLVKAIGERNLADIPVRHAALTRDGVLAQLGVGGDLQPAHLKTIFDTRILDVLFPVIQSGYHPPGFSWQDTGRFYNETTEFFDPVQGQVGDCYFIAAMSSVAWSLPFTIADRTRATATAQDSFTHQVSFFGNGSWQNVEVSDRVLVASGGSMSYYAHSSEAGEIWPAVYEKAFAQWRFGTGDDFPNIPNLAWGDPVASCVSLTGRTGYYNWHSGMTAAQVLTLVQSHSSNGRTTTPMVCWSHGGGSPEAQRAADEAGIVASHAYSVLGWMRRMEWVPRLRLDVVVPKLIPELRFPLPDPPRFGDVMSGDAMRLERLDRFDLPIDIFERYELRPVDYIIVRNPWGGTEATGSSTTGGQFRARDISWWRDIELGANGVFAIEVDAFRRYFAGTGGAH